MNGKDTNDWKNAMNEELNSFKTHNVNDIVADPGTTPISCQWVFTEKSKNEGEIVRFKARIVARGFSEKVGVDYDQILHRLYDKKQFDYYLSSNTFWECTHRNIYK
jgi:hypothetical protein